MNFAVQWIRNTRLDHTFLAKQTGLPRGYLRALRRGQAPPMKNAGPGSLRKTANDDERWRKLAHIAFPTSEPDQERFLNAIVALQTGGATEETKGALPTGRMTTETESVKEDGVTVRLHADFQGTLDFTWQGKTYRLTRIS